MTRHHFRALVGKPFPNVSKAASQYPQLCQVIERGYPNILVSYYYMEVRPFERGIVGALKDRCFFLDSGAHTANTQGVDIDLYQYMDFIHANKQAIDLYCGLDDIQDYGTTLKNQQIMESKGLNPLITFHIGEPYALLHEYCQQYQFICLGGVVGKSRQTKIKWLDNCWSVIKKYWPRKVHMFGVHDEIILSRYPFYSADASSDSLTSSMGMTVVDEKPCRYSQIPKPQTAQQARAKMTEIRKDLRPTDRAQFRYLWLVQKKIELQTKMTDLWQKRGIRWED